MGQNLLELLKQSALRNVPKPSEQERENQDFRAQAIQDTEPTWKKLGRGALESLTGFLVDDPFADPTESEQKGITRPSAGAGVGMLAAASPIGLPRRLPAIAPEAYNDVKAGGLRLYSRLTDAFAKAPKVMHANKVRDVAKQGASAEEVSLRKLEEFLSGRDQNAKIPREDIMGHLAANPIKLNVVRKGRKYEKGLPADATRIDELQRDISVLEHEFDTTYGNNWQWRLTELGPTDRLRLDTLNNERQWLYDRGDLPSSNKGAVQYDWMQTPGPKENYGETLINLPRDMEKSPLGHPQGVFQSSHWEEPNNLVWSRHNDRRLGPTEPTGKNVYGMDLGEVEETYRRAAMPTPPQQEALTPVGPKGRFTEEIQSDWHQQGRDHGYKGTPEYNDAYAKRDELESQLKHVRPAAIDALNRHLLANETPQSVHDVMQDLANRGQNWPEAEYFTSPPHGPDADAISAYIDARNAEQNHHYNVLQKFDSAVPDAPFKETYPDLQLKVDLLDWANDPELEWFGVADADTVSAMEGHASVKPGMEHFYNKKHPATLKELLLPLGGEVGYSNLPIHFNPAEEGLGVYQRGDDFQPIVAFGNQPHMDPTTSIATVMRPGDFSQREAVLHAVEDRIGQGGSVPGYGMWATGHGATGMSKEQTDALKNLIKERGFPAMMALIMLQQQMKDEQ